MKTEEKAEEYARFLAGESSVAEKEELLRKLQNDPAEQKMFELLQSFWNNYFLKIDSADSVWEKTAKKLGFEEKEIAKTRKISHILRYAAAAVLILSLGINSYFLLNKWTSNKVELIEYSTKTGEVKNVVLPDGSTVWLNSESTLILPEKFEGKNRNVYLIGQAFFKVKKNPEKPFLVNASQLIIKVLGTSFEVKNYQNDPEISASLVEGKVEVINKSTKKEAVVLRPAQEAMFYKKVGTLTVAEKPSAFVAPWRDGNFRFHNTDLHSIAHQLERKFDCEFVFVDEATQILRFTADFQNEPLDEILELLNKAHSFNLKKEGRRYVVSSRK